MKRSHTMPFGATKTAHEAHFRLWAPDANSVELLKFEGATQRESIRLAVLSQGWYEHCDSAAANVTSYAYRIDAHITVPDPASRFNAEGVHGRSSLLDPRSFDWQDSQWRGRPWQEAVIYELHVGTFTAAGNFNGVAERLAELAALGVTAIELMPVASFAGNRGWGYDGVLPFAPHPAYGTPDDLKQLVQAAHHLGLMMILDVVYNHFGPEGNYLGRYANAFFNPAHQTPWGPAINLDGAHSAIVREFFIHNALYWLDEFHFDGLRLDAVHALRDDSPLYFVDELAQRVKRGPGRERCVHLIVENHCNQAALLARSTDGEPVSATAQWNDDFHHPLHVIVTGEHEGYYVDYAREPLAQLGRAMAEGFVFQGEYSEFDRAKRGESSEELPPLAMINFLQSHDQIGNRAFGERLTVLTGAEQLRACYALLLLQPGVPMLFMGEEFAATPPFLYFCDFAGELGAAVTAGRRQEFAGFTAFGTQQVPDPCDEKTFLRSRLDWSERAARLDDWLNFVHELLALRHRAIVPLMSLILRNGGRYATDGRVLKVEWRLSDGRQLCVRANLGQQPAAVAAAKKTLFCTHASAGAILPAWAVEWSIEPAA